MTKRRTKVVLEKQRRGSLRKLKQRTEIGDLFLAGATVEQIAKEHALTEAEVKTALLDLQRVMTDRLVDLGEQIGSMAVARIERLLRPWYLRAIREAEGPLQADADENTPKGSTAMGVVMRLLDSELDWKKALGTALLPTGQPGDLTAFNDFEQTIIQGGQLYKAAALAMGDKFLSDASIPIDQLYRQVPEDDPALAELARELKITDPPSGEQAASGNPAAPASDPESSALRPPDQYEFVTGWAADLHKALDPTGYPPDGEVADPSGQT